MPKKFLKNIFRSFVGFVNKCNRLKGYSASIVWLQRSELSYLSLFIVTGSAYIILK